MIAAVVECLKSLNNLEFDSIANNRILLLCVSANRGASAAPANQGNASLSQEWRDQADEYVYYYFVRVGTLELVCVCWSVSLNVNCVNVQANSRPNTPR